MLHSLSLSIFVIFIIIILLSLGIIAGIRLYKNLKNEKHQEQGKVIQRIMKTYTVLQCVIWPLIMVCAMLLRANTLFIKFLAPSLERHVICMLRFLFSLFRTYIGFNSLIIAICRYCFIVFHQMTSAVGIDKARKLLLCGSFGVPLLATLLHEATTPMAHAWTSLSTAEDSFQSTIYELASRLLPTFVTDGIAILCMSLRAVIFSNIGEGLIYLHIYIYGRR